NGVGSVSGIGVGVGIVGGVGIGGSVGVEITGSVGIGGGIGIEITRGDDVDGTWGVDDDGWGGATASCSCLAFGLVATSNIEGNKGLGAPRKPLFIFPNIFLVRLTAS
ncbi:hypothetical protein Tco_0482696, partial [Tanacetum coccineum]